MGTGTSALCLSPLGWLAGHPRTQTMGHTLTKDSHVAGRQTPSSGAPAPERRKALRWATPTELCPSFSESPWTPGWTATVLPRHRSERHSHPDGGRSSPRLPPHALHLGSPGHLHADQLAMHAGPAGSPPRADGPLDRLTELREVLCSGFITKAV